MFYENRNRGIRKSRARGGNQRKNLGYEITGIFSRRNVTSPFGTKVFDFKNFGSFDTETDIMLLCGGSKTNLREQSRIVAKRFNTADTFDTHAEIAEHIKELDDIQQKRRGVSITAAGWDPGVFSVARVAFCAFLLKSRIRSGAGARPRDTEKRSET